MKIQHDYEELGFFLAIDRDRNGNIIRRIERGGPADRAGLRDGDRILGKIEIRLATILGYGRQNCNQFELAWAN